MSKRNLNCGAHIQPWKSAFAKIMTERWDIMKFDIEIENTSFITKAKLSFWLITITPANKTFTCATTAVCSDFGRPKTRFFSPSIRSFFGNVSTIGDGKYIYKCVRT